MAATKKLIHGIPEPFKIKMVEPVTVLDAS